MILLLRRRFVKETFSSVDVLLQETFCYGDFVTETFCAETFCMCALYTAFSKYDSFRTGIRTLFFFVLNTIYSTV
jgi:hypothetical protein